MIKNLQKDHYELIHDEYLAHYYDPTSMEYRHKFLYKYLFKDIDLNNKKVADLACGSGYNSLSLLEYFPKAQVSGFDISNKACEDYKKILNRPSYEVDLTKNMSFKKEYDFVMIIGGLHHCVSDLDATFENIYSLLKPNGTLLMFEPNKKYFLEPVRKYWYKKDKYFEENTEAALDHKMLISKYFNKFDSKTVYYLGGPAYFLIYNSLLFRFPTKYKKLISPILMKLEQLYNILPGKCLFPYFIASWTKK
ncbi:MAG: class I SAM-dependent methyltransferase [Janthinobacterium lividum]